MHNRKRKGVARKHDRDSVDRWNSRTQFADRARKTRQTLWRWQQAGLLPDPDGHDPFGNPLWRDSTIDSFLAGEPEAA